MHCGCVSGYENAGVPKLLNVACTFVIVEIVGSCDHHLLLVFKKFSSTFIVFTLYKPCALPDHSEGLHHNGSVTTTSHILVIGIVALVLTGLATTLKGKAPLPIFALSG